MRKALAFGPAWPLQFMAQARSTVDGGGSALSGAAPDISIAGSGQSYRRNAARAAPRTAADAGPARRGPATPPGRSLGDGNGVFDEAVVFCIIDIHAAFL